MKDDNILLEVLKEIDEGITNMKMLISPIRIKSIIGHAVAKYNQSPSDEDESKAEQKKKIIEIMEADEKDGIYDESNQDELFNDAMKMFSIKMNEPEEDGGGWFAGIAELKSQYSIHKL